MVNADFEVSVAAPANIVANFDTLSAQLDQVLAEYDGVIITPDQVADAKAQATKINKLGEAISRRRIDTVKEITKPVTAFEEKAKELTTRCKEARSKILEQVRALEERQLKECRELVADYLGNLLESKGIRDEFWPADSKVEAIPKLSSLTATGKLTAGTRREVEALVAEAEARQNRTDRRLAELENLSHRAGLSSPLTREHVAPVLFADDDAYTSHVDGLIEREKQREAAAVERERQRAAKEQAAKEQSAREAARRAQEAPREAEAARAAQGAEKAPEELRSDPLGPEQCVRGDGAGAALPEVSQGARESDPAQGGRGEHGAAGGYRRTLTFTVILALEVPSNIEAGAVKAMLLDKLHAAGVRQSVSSVTLQEDLAPETAPAGDFG